MYAIEEFTQNQAGTVKFARDMFVKLASVVADPLSIIHKPDVLSIMLSNVGLVSEPEKDGTEPRSSPYRFHSRP